MNKWTARIVIIALLVIVVALPIVLRPATADIAADSLRLIVMTPHNEQIRYEIEHAFSQWHQQRYGQPVVIDWRAFGTSDIERILFSQYRQAAEAGRADQDVGYDVVFGGGDYMFDRVLKPGVRYRGPDGTEQSLPVTQPIRLDTELVEQVFGENNVGGEKTFDPDGHWWGVVLSSFGIAYNHDLVARLGLPEPTTWLDMTDPRLQRWVALADPSHSGSVRVTYEAILRYGTLPPEAYADDTTGEQRFLDGMAALRRMFANARYFSPSSTKVPLDVSAGEAVMGICIDYYGRFQSSQIGGGRRVGFVAPARQTKISADPVAVLNGVTDEGAAGDAPGRLTLATRFVEYLLSAPGQAIWNLPIGAELPGPDGETLRGPIRFELRRAPVHRELYEPEYFTRMIDQVDPYAIAEPVPRGTPYYFSELPTLVHAMCLDVHDDLKAAWRVINETEDEPLRQRMLEEFDKLPYTYEQVTSVRRERWKVVPGSEDADRLLWTKFFRKQYRTIVAMTEGER